MSWRRVRVDGVFLASCGNVRWVSANLVLQIGQVCIELLERSNLALDHLVRESTMSSSRDGAVSLQSLGHFF